MTSLYRLLRITSVLFVVIPGSIALLKRTGRYTAATPRNRFTDNEANTLPIRSNLPPLPYRKLPKSLPASKYFPVKSKTSSSKFNLNQYKSKTPRVVYHRNVTPTRNRPMERRRLPYLQPTLRQSQTRIKVTTSAPPGQEPTSTQKPPIPFRRLFLDTQTEGNFSVPQTSGASQVDTNTLLVSLIENFFSKVLGVIEKFIEKKYAQMTPFNSIETKKPEIIPETNVGHSKTEKFLPTQPSDVTTLETTVTVPPQDQIQNNSPTSASSNVNNTETILTPVKTTTPLPFLFSAYETKPSETSTTTTQAPLLTLSQAETQSSDTQQTQPTLSIVTSTNTINTQSEMSFVSTTSVTNDADAVIFSTYLALQPPFLIRTKNETSTLTTEGTLLTRPSLDMISERDVIIEKIILTPPPTEAPQTQRDFVKPIQSAELTFPPLVFTNFESDEYEESSTSSVVTTTPHSTAFTSQETYVSQGRTHSGIETSKTQNPTQSSDMTESGTTLTGQSPLHVLQTESTPLTTLLIDDSKTQATVTGPVELDQTQTQNNSSISACSNVNNTETILTPVKTTTPLPFLLSEYETKPSETSTTTTQAPLLTLSQAETQSSDTQQTQPTLSIVTSTNTINTQSEMSLVSTTSVTNDADAVIFSTYLALQPPFLIRTKNETVTTQGTPLTRPSLDMISERDVTIEKIILTSPPREAPQAQRNSAGPIQSAELTPSPLVITNFESDEYEESSTSSVVTTTPHSTAFTSQETYVSQGAGQSSLHTLQTESTPLTTPLIGDSKTQTVTGPVELDQTQTDSGLPTSSDVAPTQTILSPSSPSQTMPGQTILPHLPFIDDFDSDLQLTLGPFLGRGRTPRTVSVTPTLSDSKCRKTLSLSKLYFNKVLQNRFTKKCSETTRPDSTPPFQSSLNTTPQGTIPSILSSSEISTSSTPSPTKTCQPETVSASSETSGEKFVTPAGGQTSEVTPQDTGKFRIHTKERLEGHPFSFWEKSPYMKSSTKTIIIGFMPEDDKKKLQSYINENLNLIRNVITFDLTTIQGHIPKKGLQFSSNATRNYFRDRLIKLHETYNLKPEQVKLTQLNYETDETGDYFGP